MDKILDFVNALHYPFKFDSCQKLLDDWEGAKIYNVSSSEEKGLCLGFPILVSEKDGKLEIVKSHPEILHILALSQTV